VRTADHQRAGGNEGAEDVLVLGIDPGTATTGFGVVRRSGVARVSLVECGVVRTSATEPLPVRIREIYDAIAALIERHRPFAVSVEEVFHGKNAQSALKLGHARGAILLAAAHHDIMIAEYAPRQIKKAVVGTGNATKDQVGFMVMQQLRLRQAPTPADAADGVAAALCHCMIGSFPR
jgi:crossover junction endodeoxyribonuclease RuvC